MPAHFGLDIGSSSIKVVKIDGKKVKCAMAINPINKGFDKTSLQEREALVAAIKTLLGKANLGSNKVVVGVPESLVFSKMMHFPIVSSAELASAIKWQAEQDVPLPIDEVDLSWTVIDKPKRNTGMEKMSVLVVAMPKKASLALVDLLTLLGLEPVRAENETLSLARVFVVNRKVQERVMIVDMGAESVKMALMENGLLLSIFSSFNSGMAMSRALAGKFGLSVADAEKYKRTYGLNKNQLEGKVYNGIEPILEALIQEMKRFGGEKTVSRVIMVGGGVFLGGLIPFLSEKLGVEVVIGNALEGLKVPEGQANLFPVYAVAAGLASEERA